MPSRILQLVSVGGLPALFLKTLQEPLLTQMGITTTASKTQLPAPSYAFNKDRNQYHSNAILRRLAPLLDRVDFVLGVADVDIFVPDSPFVFGEADRESRVAVISVFRLSQNVDDEARKRRARIEAVHQVGHLLGLSNCDDPRCAMFLATSAGEIDRKGTSLCNLCRNELAKLSR
jgi:archaemetzincin